MKKNAYLAMAVAMTAATASLCSCQGNKTQAQAEPAQTHSLILYYSQTGATRQVAELLQQKVGADLEAIDVTQPYDGDYGQTIARCQEEMASGQLPELVALTHDVAAYDTIYLGYPVWFGTYAPPVQALVKANDFAGKVLVPFCTFGSGGLNTTMAQLHEALPQAQILPGYGVRNARVAKAGEELDRYLVANGIKEGEVETLPDFSAQQPLTPADQTTFDEACGSYPMPLGQPVSVGSRELNEATEYLFSVESQSHDGQVQQAQIYVLKSKAEGAKAEFTQVAR